MAKTKTIALGLALAGAGVYGVYSAGSCLLGDDETQGTRHVVNQVWIERAPEGPRDLIGHLVLLDLPDGRIGVTGKSSQWRHLIELFQWDLEGNRLRVHFPQDRVRAKVEVRSWRCAGEAPEPFELCLELSNGRRTAMFYSLDEWKIDPDRAAESLEEIATEHPEFAEFLPSVSVPVALDSETLEGYDEDDSAFVLLGK